MKISCAYCGDVFTAKRSHAKFCSKSCCVLWHRLEKDSFQFRTEIDLDTDDIEVYKQYITEKEWDNLKELKKGLYGLSTEDHCITIYLMYWKNSNKWEFDCSWWTGHKFEVNPRTISTKVENEHFLALLEMYRLSHKQ